MRGPHDRENDLYIGLLNKKEEKLFSGHAGGIVRYFSKDLNVEWTAVPFSGSGSATISAAGELLQSDPAVIDEKLMIVVEREAGIREILNFSEFRRRYQKSR